MIQKLTCIHNVANVQVFCLFVFLPRVPALPVSQVGDDGRIMDRFTHKSLLPEDMDPLSVSGTLTPEGVLVISVKSMSRSQSRP